MKKGVHHYVDLDMYKDFKILCLERNISISAALEKLIKKALEKSKTEKDGE